MRWVSYFDGGPQAGAGSAGEPSGRLISFSYDLFSYFFDFLKFLEVIY